MLSKHSICSITSAASTIVILSSATSCISTPSNLALCWSSLTGQTCFILGDFLARNKSRYLWTNGRVERIGPGWIEHTGRWENLVDPLDIEGMIKGQPSHEEYWSRPVKWCVCKEVEESASTNSGTKGVEKQDHSLGHTEEYIYFRLRFVFYLVVWAFDSHSFHFLFYYKSRRYVSFLQNEGFKHFLIEECPQLCICSSSDTARFRPRRAPRFGIRSVLQSSLRTQRS